MQFTALNRDVAKQGKCNKDHSKNLGINLLTVKNKQDLHRYDIFFFFFDAGSGIGIIAYHPVQTFVARFRITRAAEIHGKNLLLIAIVLRNRS